MSALKIPVLGSILPVPVLLLPVLLGNVSLATDGPSDRELELAIEQQFSQNLRVTHGNLRDKLEVRVTAGVVTLAGEVPSYSDRMHVQRLCARVAGVERIDNRLVIRPAVIGDSELKRAAQQRLDADNTLIDDEIEVDAAGGMVTLRGRVGSWLDHRRATLVVRQVQGVLDVRPELEIAPNPGTGSSRKEATSTACLDAEIRQELEALLHGNGPLSDFGIEFVVADGRVVLHGSIHHLTLREVLRELVRLIPGVIEVDVQQLTLSQIPFAAQIGEDANFDSVISLLQLAADSAVSAGQESILVSEHQGAVVLSGTVQSLARKQRISRLAKALSKGREIRNVLVVEPIPRDDQVIARELTQIIAQDSRLHGAVIEVTVTDAHAVLTGHVDDFNAKLRLARIAATISGIAQVTNNATVAWSPYFSDDGLKKSIEKRLKQNAIDDVAVSVSDGVATLRSVSNRTVSQEARGIAELTDGVRSVVVAAQFVKANSD